MPTGGGFYSEEQENNFRDANVLYRRGGQAEIVCGARTRAGGLCRGKPLIGSRRCIKHAGPHAARAFRERQLVDLGRGKITPDDFAASEARRAANRLRDRWKKNPWLPGSTINLGEHEEAFLAESGLDLRLEPVPPAVSDWLRWKYRRLQIDRKRHDQWVQVRRVDFPRRVLDAGPPTADDLIALEQQPATASDVWVVGSSGSFSRRQNLDRPKMKSAPTLRRLRRARVRNIDPDTLARMICEHHKLLGPLFENCRDDAEKISVVAALQDYLADPNEPKALNRWMEIVRVLDSPRG